MSKKTEPKYDSARIVRADEHNYGVQIYTRVETAKKVGNKIVKTGEVRGEWQDKGYYGHRLDWAAESALFLSMPYGEQITSAMLKAAVQEIVKNVK